jgi:hypothetical protein
MEHFGAFGGDPLQRYVDFVGGPGQNEHEAPAPEREGLVEAA